MQVNIQRAVIACENSTGERWVQVPFGTYYATVDQSGRVRLDTGNESYWVTEGHYDLVFPGQLVGA